MYCCLSVYDCEKNKEVKCFEQSSYGPRREKNLSSGFANNKSADQPARPCRLISAFVIRFLESII